MESNHITTQKTFQNFSSILKSLEYIGAGKWGMNKKADIGI
jgi:hypothetical protein